MSPPAAGGAVDVHHHFVPDHYREALLAAGVVHPDGMAEILAWSEAEARPCLTLRAALCASGQSSAAELDSVLHAAAAALLSRR